MFFIHFEWKEWKNLPIKVLSMNFVSFFAFKFTFEKVFMMP